MELLRADSARDIRHLRWLVAGLTAKGRPVLPGLPPELLPTLRSYLAHVLPWGQKIVACVEEFVRALRFTCAGVWEVIQNDP